MNTTKLQKSESLVLGILLTLSGGIMDAYSYLCRGKVFANAQTGNIVLLAIHFTEGNYGLALRYLFPILSFVTGIALAGAVHHRTSETHLHWRQYSLVVEMVLLLVVSFLPSTYDLLANCLTSFACGVQVEAFRKIAGHSIATTMCIGNLRTATDALVEYHYHKEKEQLHKSLFFYGFIGIFALGAVLGNFVIQAFSYQAMLTSVGLLFFSFIIMFEWNKQEDQRNAETKEKNEG